LVCSDLSTGRKLSRIRHFRQAGRSSRHRPDLRRVVARETPFAATVNAPGVIASQPKFKDVIQYLEGELHLSKGAFPKKRKNGKNRLQGKEIELLPTNRSRDHGSLHCRWHSGGTGTRLLRD
jgi:hypothetical protein